MAVEWEHLSNYRAYPVEEDVQGNQGLQGRTFAEKSAVLHSQVRFEIEYMIGRREHITISGASIILAELCGVLLGLRRSEFLVTAEGRPNLATLLCFRNLAGHK